MFKDWARETEEGAYQFQLQPNEKGAVEIGMVLIEHGYQDSEQHVQDVFPVTKGKNIGKVNQTTPYEQAVLEADSRARKKLDQNYRRTLKELDSLPVGPMLAHPFEKRKHNLEYPVAVQPKLDGVRCLAHKVGAYEVELRSRMGKLFDIPHLEKELAGMLEVGEVWDGELYVHGWTFERIVSAVKAFKEDTKSLQFHVYDMVSEISPFEMRYDYVAAKLKDLDESEIKLVPQREAQSEEDVYAAEEELSAQGYEGCIVRNIYGLYKIGGRSADLLKLKPMQTDEYPIVGMKLDVRGAAIFICETPEGKTFDPVPAAPIAVRREWAKNEREFIGKTLTVKYHHLSEEGIPVPNPVGLGVRDYE